MTAPAEPHVMKTYGRLPIALSHGRGCRVWDTDGREYLDALGGIAVNTLGHAHPRLVPALQEQVAKLIHTSNYYHVPLQEQLAARLTALSGLTNAFFCNSGLEANEAALKIARKYGHDRGIERPEIIVYEKAFHGRSIATLSATGNPKIQAGFGPLVEGFVRVPLNDLAAIDEVCETCPNVVAVFLETIQGEGGINPARWEYLEGLRRDLRRAGLAVDARRGAVRHRPHRQVVRTPVGRHPTRRDALGQGPGLGRTDRRGRLRPESCRGAGSGQPRHHLWWQSVGDARRCRNPQDHGRRRSAGQCPRRRRRIEGRARTRVRRAWRASPTSAAPG